MGGKTSTTSSGVTIPPSVLAQYNSVTAQANQTATTPFQTYSGQFVAPTTTEQNTGIANTNTAAGSYQPYYDAATSTLGATQANTTGVNDAATGLAAAGSEGVNATPLTGSQIDSYLSPYLGEVLGSTEAIQNQENQQQQSGQLGNAITSGAFGSDRTGIAAANLEEQQNLANNSTIANIANTGYVNAQGVAQQQQGVNLSAGQANRAALETAATNLAGIGSTAYGEGANTSSELGALGTGAQTAGLAGANAQIAAGTVQQQTEQAQDTAEYNQFLQEQSYPFQVGSWLAGISEGIGTNEGSTTTTTQPGGFFSDERLKKDIKKIGKTYDGQTIYSYKMGDDPRTRIGLIAQEVEKKHPQAVGLAAGFKMVDYGKATGEAANRGHFNMGGVVPIRRVARAYGGGTDINGVLQAQQQMYSGVGGASTQRQMPAQSNGGGHLVVSNAPPAAPHNGASDVSQAMQMANQGNKLYKSFNSPSTSPAAPAQAGVAGPGVQPSGATTFADPSVSASPSGVAPATSGWAPAADSAAGTAAPAAADAAAPAAADAAAPAAADAAAGAATGAAAGAGADAATAAAAELAADYVGADALAAAALAKRGGRIKRDVGGGMPYSDPSGGYEIPDNEMTDNSLKAAPAAGKQPTGLQTLMYMGDPNNTSSLMGSMFSNEALARGGVAGRGKFADGGSPDDAPEPSLDDQPDGGLASAATAAPSTGSGGLAAASADPDSDSLLKKAGKWFTDNRSALLPIMNGIAAMGTAKTVHPGVALAAGLGAGANSYLDSQQSMATTSDIQAKARGQQLANSLSEVTNQAAMDALAGKGPYASQLKTSQASAAAQPTGGQSAPVVDPAQTAASIDASTRAKYATTPITPDEQSFNARMNTLSAATKNPEWAQMAATRQANRVQADTFANQQAAQHDAATYQAIMNDPTQSQEIRSAAAAHYNATMQFTGSKLEDVGGSMRESTTGAPAQGARAQQLTPAQKADITLREAAPVQYGANAAAPLRQYAADTGSPLPNLGANANGSSAAVAPIRGGTPGSPTPNPNGADPFQGAPMKPPYVDNPRMVLTDEQKDMSKAYAAKEQSLRAEAGNLTATQQEQINVQRILGELQNSRTGPGMDAVSKFQTTIGNMTGNDWHDFFQNDPAAFQMLTKGTGNEAFFKTMKDMRDSGGEVRLGQKSEEIIMNELSASPMMARNAITSMMNWRLQDLNAAAKRENAIPAYLDNGHDALKFDNLYPNKVPLSSQLSVTPNAVNPTVAGVPTSTNSPPPTRPTGPVQVRSKAEADALPPNTLFLTPAGKLKRTASQ
jgi:hypothetical protein